MVRLVALVCLAVLCAPRASLGAEDMLHWCAKAYPDRIAWCKTQYPGSLDETGPHAAMPETAKPESARPGEALPAGEDSRLAARRAAKITAFGLNASGAFDARPDAFAPALKAATAYGPIRFDEPTCFENNDHGPDCMVGGDDSTHSAMAFRAASGPGLGRVAFEFAIDTDKDQRTELTAFAIVADALSRLFDPDLSDATRSALMTQLAESYFRSGRVAGEARGRAARYTLREEDASLTLTLTPQAGAGEAGQDGGTDPVAALVAGLARPDLVKLDPVLAPAVQAQIAERRELLRVLLSRLDGFRYNRLFHARGFACCTIFSDWLQSLEGLRPPEPGVLRDAMFRYGLIDGWTAIISLGFDYMHTDGRDTEDTRRWRGLIAKALESR